MKYQFIVTLETDEATPEELEEAITDMLRVADMPNGDTLYIDYPMVEYMPPNAKFTGPKGPAQEVNHE